MSRSSHKPITGKTKSCIKNGIMETPELLGKGWELRILTGIPDTCSSQKGIAQTAERLMGIL